MSPDSEPRTFHAIVNADNAPTQVFAGHQDAMARYTELLDQGATDLDLTNNLTATAILSDMEYQRLPVMMTDKDWIVFASTVHQEYVTSLLTHTDADHYFVRDGIQPDLPIPVAESILQTLDYYAPPRFPEFQYVCEAAEIVMAASHHRRVKTSLFSEASLAVPSYQERYDSLTLDALSDELNNLKADQSTQQTHTSPAQLAQYECQSQIEHTKLKFAQNQAEDSPRSNYSPAQ